MYAHEFNMPFTDVDGTEAAFERVRRACAERGRDPEDLVYSAAQVVCCGKDEAEFRRRAAAIGRDPEDMRLTGLGGTPGQVAAKIAEFAEIGADCLYLQVLDLGDLDHLELLASDVAPQVV